MYSEVIKKTDRLVNHCSPSLFADRQIGLEKESLRVSAHGGISQRDHPEALGRALTHPNITTDFSEALLEMVTPPCASADDAINYLTAIHQFIVQRLPEGEHIWNTSMPCILRGGQSVRIGEYGSSHSGQMKHAYRRGLGLRYGRRMQAIAGVHFNFSVPDPSWLVQTKLNAQLPDIDLCEQLWQDTSAIEQQALRTQGYFCMMQNLLRIGWLVPYLFGASPAICASFLNEGEGDELSVWNTSTRYAQHGTSLRMGKIGYRYREDQPIDLTVRHTDVDAYIADIIGHVSTEHPAYRDLGLFDGDGLFQQLSTARLQIENEYYSSVRPKQIANSGELPIHALRERGIRYLELRSVDVNLEHPNGLELEQVAFLELLMLFAWMAKPAPLGADEVQACTSNVKKVAHSGREPGLQLQGPQGDISLSSWGLQIMRCLEPVASWLDQERQTPLYLPALQAQKAKLEDSELTPSARILAGIKETGSFFEYAQDLSKAHHATLGKLPQDEAIHASLLQKVQDSITMQTQMEDSSSGSFETFLGAYLNQIHKADAASV